MTTAQGEFTSATGWGPEVMPTTGRGQRNAGSNAEKKCAAAGAPSVRKTLRLNESVCRARIPSTPPLVR